MILIWLIFQINMPPAL